jgi:hypothetical protein
MSLLARVAAAARPRAGADSTRSPAASVLALGMSILVFFPLFPAMPSAGADPSWRMALNEAWARDFDFGRVVFTYGPYAFLSTEQYHPDTFVTLMVCSLFLGTLLFLLLREIELVWKRPIPVTLILSCLIASGYTSAPDVRFICYGFLFLVAAAGRRRKVTDAVGSSPLLGAPILLSMAAFSLGLICLVKATYAVEAGIMVALAMVVLQGTERRPLALAILVSCCLGLVFFWLIAGQSLMDLPRFFHNQAQVVLGYGPAMSVGEGILPPALFLISSIPLAIAIERDLQPPSAGKWAMAIGLGLVLFLSFKEGFVRQDEWHVMTAAEVLFILPWCWPFDRVDLWRHVQAAAAACTAAVFMVQFPHALDVQAKMAQLESVRHCSGRGPVVCPFRSGWLRKTYDLSLARLAREVPLPRVQGTVDVYTTSQYIAIAHGWRWDPRPVLQSYSAYTPALARMNAQHLTGARAPDGVLFALDAIDFQLPALADGPSWPILLSQYGVEWLSKRRQPAGGQPVAYLRHEPDWRRITIIRTPLLAQKVALGQRLKLPPSDAVLFATIAIRPDIYGQFEQFLFKNPRLYINFRFPDGGIGRYRFIPGMARAGFIISPVVADTAQFVALQGLRVRRTLSNRRPVAFWLSGARGAPLIWANAAAVEISSLQVRN